MTFFVVTGMALSVISCISSVDSATNLFLSSLIFLSTQLGFHKQFDTCRINFHIRSNVYVGIMAGNRDTVNQSET